MKVTCSLSSLILYSGWLSGSGCFLSANTAVSKSEFNFILIKKSVFFTVKNIIRSRRVAWFYTHFPRLSQNSRILDLNICDAQVFRSAPFGVRNQKIIFVDSKPNSSLRLHHWQMNFKNESASSCKCLFNP